MALAALALAVSALPLGAQDSLAARVLKPLKNVGYVVVIGRDTMIAVTAAVAQRALTADVELKGARLEMAVKDSLIATNERALAWSDSTIARQKLLIAQLDSLYRGYRDVASGYKRLSGEPWLSFEGGLGATGPDHKPAILAGLGIRSVRIWGFLEEGNAGGLLGVHLRLF